MSDYIPGGAPTSYQHISNLRYWVQFVTPIVYDDSLTVYELMYKVVGKLNEVINVVNPLGEGIEKTIQDALDAYKTEWENELAEFQTTINNTINQNNIALNKRIDELTEDIQNQIDTFISTVNNSINEFKTYTLGLIAETNQQIKDSDDANRAWTLAQIEELRNSLPDELPPVIDPSDGLLESVQTALNHMWDAWRENALTAAEYDALDLTATAYDEKELTAIAYDRYGKILLDSSSTAFYSNGIPLNKSAVSMTALKAHTGMSNISSFIN